MKLSEIKDTGRRIEKGAWVGNLPNLPGVSVKVRGAFNSDYNKRFAELAAKYSPEELKDEAIQTSIDNDLLIETILEDWHGIDDFEFSKENALTVLTDEDLKILKRGVNYAANNVAQLGRDSIEDAAKN